jgi:hypothetical protein
MSRSIRTLLGAAAAVLAMTVLTSTSGAARAETQPQIYVSLHGGGAWSIYGPLVSWQNELATASSYVDLNYTAHGSMLGRQDLVKGNNDFVISGVPFTAEELKGVKGRAAAFIDAPVQVATLATFVEPLFARPVAAFRTVSVICDPDDESTWPQGFTDPDQCIVRAAYSGPLRIPNRNLAAMFVHYQGTGTLPLNAWNNHDVMRAMGLDPAKSIFDTQSLQAAPGFAGRSDADETTYFLQQFIKQTAPDVWQALKDAERRIAWEPVTERFPRALNGVTRDGAEQQVEQLAQSGNGVTGVFTPSVSGGIAPAPPALMRAFDSAFPNQPMVFAESQNANGDWAGPTPAQINKAVDAGGDTPLYALTHKVAGAYPLVWVDHLYAPAHGLSIEKTQGIATLIRYLATTGQDKEDSAGEGRLSPPLVAEALAAANNLVTSNCTGSDRTIVSNGDPGPGAPATATAMKSIGTMLHCEPAGPVTTTTTTASSSTTIGSTAPSSTGGSTNGYGQSSDGSGTAAGAAQYTGVTSTGSSGASTGNSAGGTAAAGGDGETSGGGTGGPAAAALVVAHKLPMAPPGGAAGTDRLAAFLLGALLYLLLRGPVGRMAHRLRT